MLVLSQVGSDVPQGEDAPHCRRVVSDCELLGTAPYIFRHLQHHWVRKSGRDVDWQNRDMGCCLHNGPGKALVRPRSLFFQGTYSSLRQIRTLASAQRAVTTIL